MFASSTPFPLAPAQEPPHRRLIGPLRVRIVVLGEEELLPGEAGRRPCPLDQLRQDAFAVARWPTLTRCRLTSSVPMSNFPKFASREARADHASYLLSGGGGGPGCLGRGIDFRSCAVAMEFPLQSRMQLVECYTDNFVLSYRHGICPPPQSALLCVVQAGTSSHDHQSRKAGVARAECGCEPLRILEIFEVVEPINDLAESVFEASTPLGILSFLLLLEDRILLAVLKFHNTELVLLLAPYQYVGLEITEELSL